MKKKLQKLSQLMTKKAIKPYSQGCKLNTYINQRLFNNAFELYIYDTQKNMNSGIKKWLSNNSYSNSPEDYSELAGLVFENKKMPLKEINGDEFRIFAAMFLCEEHLTPSLIAHESLHAAMVLERNVIRFVGLYDGDDGSGDSAEERLAYCIDDFTDSIIKNCLKYKVKLNFILQKKCKNCCNKKECKKINYSGSYCEKCED